MKNSKQIPTAEEFYFKTEQRLEYQMATMDCFFTPYDVIARAMIDFAQLHVKAALDAAFLNSKMRISENDTTEFPSFTDNYDDGYVTITISKDSILSAYPEELIK